MDTTNGIPNLVSTLQQFHKPENTTCFVHYLVNSWSCLENIPYITTHGQKWPRCQMKMCTFSLTWGRTSLTNAVMGSWPLVSCKKSSGSPSGFHDNSLDRSSSVSTADGVPVVSGVLTPKGLGSWFTCHDTNETAGVTLQPATRGIVVPRIYNRPSCAFLTAILHKNCSTNRFQHHKTSFLTQSYRHVSHLG